MAWRFKASKYKNAAPIVPKPETYVRDICVGSYQTYGNNITASAKFMAFNWEHAGSSLAVLPIDDCGRKSKLMPLLHAHTDTVTDMDFSPFHDGLLATGSQDCLVKIWTIPPEGLAESLSNPECVFSHKQRRVETVGFHPTADFLLHSTSYTTLTLWDLITEKELFSNSDHDEVIQSVSWKQDGTLLATSCKDKQVRIIDPRSDSPCVKQANSHQSIKDSRVVWLGDQNRILTTGFDAQRLRQIIIRDLRNFKETEKTLELDCSTGILIPLYDADTGMLFLAGKGDTTIGYMEVTDKDPHLIEGIRHSGEQTKGACLIPKRALNVMQGEVNRIMQLTSSSVVPVTYQVPRKTYRDFHADLYPDTPGYKTELTADQWIEKINIPLPRISLDPSKREKGEELITVHRGSIQDLRKEFEESKANRTSMQVQKPKMAEPVEEKHPVKNIIKEIENEKSPIEEKVKLFDNPDKKMNLINKPTAEDVVSDKEKPRLGPKPFTPPKLNDTENSFSKVFAVPQVPGLTSATSEVVAITPEQEKEKSPTSDNEVVQKETENGKSGSSGEEETSCDSGYIPKTPSTAERRKLFETRNSSKENEPEDNFDTTDQSGNFDRNSAQRNSIAERRKMYERSQSQQEPPATIIEKSVSSPVLLRRKDSFKAPKNPDDVLKEENNRRSVPVARQQSLDPQAIKKSEGVVAPKRTSTVFGRVSKFRHLKGTTAHKSFHIENIRNLSRQISGECDGFHANPERVAVPLSGPGGKIAIFELKKTGKLPDGVIPTLVQGNNIMDFQWDPFDNQRLAVACDDGVIKIWKIPENGLTEPTNEPEKEFNAHGDKIYFIKFHPTSKDVLASGSYDMTIKLWDLTTLTEQISLKGHTDQIFSFCWSPCGNMCATVCKDGKLRVYNPRKSDVPIKEGKGPEGNRGARIVWALDSRYLVTMGFDKVSERQISIYKATDLNSPLNTVGLDVSPAILIPFYDEDSSTLFCTGKGDLTIYAFEITEEHPYICPLSHHRCNSLHQGLSFLPKNVCDVQNVEFAKAYRLTNNSIEPLSFTVPRIKTELFQDDLFPPTRVTWSPTCSSSEWFTGKDKPVQRISLKPDGMESLTETQPTQDNRTINKSASSPFIGTSKPYNKLAWSPELSSQTKNKQEEIQKSVSNRLEVNLKLEQDEMEGVDEKEWNE
ncbi:coronin-7 isoform X2 [Anthonomus grandis grandis]|uniref:coronin-7 isoform X2 n=1 Tax=Anthonomus grandis grandis TaxID=2921223 RepID=UPI002165EE5F|nr:coronin-7 isoform X2 [Anthonomus grandis grandis]